MAVRLDWKQKAACRDLDTSLFFPDSESDAPEALEVCAICPVRDECLEFALSTRQHDGVWGGTTESERKRIRRRRAAGTGPRRTEAA
ncbi:MAG TPA: WhiB family transcriptional regulator [Acidimicrobiales bacterium]|jgi:WhiB family redox-sensing transcriptional regulator|nr:WhiB family transcriptional regulator [Acidimicrobiales bacterium]